MEPSPADASRHAPPGQNTERRIAWLTLLLGVLSALTAYFLHRPQFALGLFFGTGLAWLNFRWLSKGLDALVLGAVAQQGREKPQVPLWTYFAAALRYGLLALAVYAIFILLHVPLASLILGLCSLAVAAIAASVWEILHTVD